MTKEIRSSNNEVRGQELAIELNGRSRQVAAGTTIADLLAELGVEPRHVAVERNLDVVPRARHAEQSVSAGDRIEIVTLVGGG
ncbi:MAG: sulfur carrier protein ThiS [Planctomycetes bacterium]|nr:sulfur carrier protein ThiS [Planctomycetota bacterium]